MDLPDTTATVFYVNRIIFTIDSQLDLIIQDQLVIDMRAYACYFYGDQKEEKTTADFLIESQTVKQISARLNITTSAGVLFFLNTSRWHLARFITP